SRLTFLSTRVLSASASILAELGRDFGEAMHLRRLARGPVREPPSRRETEVRFGPGGPSRARAPSWRFCICRPAQWSDHWTTSCAVPGGRCNFDKRLIEPVSYVPGCVSISAPTGKAVGPICVLAEIGPTTEAVFWE